MTQFIPWPVDPPEDEIYHLRQSDSVLDKPFFHVISTGEMEKADICRRRLRELGVGARYLRPPTIHDFRAEGLYLVGMFPRFLYDLGWTVMQGSASFLAQPNGTFILKLKISQSSPVLLLPTILASLIVGTVHYRSQPNTNLSRDYNSMKPSSSREKVGGLIALLL